MSPHMMLVALRHRAGLSQEAAARALRISRATIANWEHGRSCPPADRLAQLMRTYGATPDDVVSLLELYA